MPGRSTASARWRAAIWSGCRPSRACAATSTRTAICCGAAWVRSRSSSRGCCRGWPSRPGSIRWRRGRVREAVAHHTARSFRHLRVREGGRARRMGGVGRVCVLEHGCRRARGQGALGWSTLVQIVEASSDDRLAVIDTLAKQLVANFGAPTIEDAVAAAEEEVAFAEPLCSQPQDTLVAVHRVFEDGAVRETFRTLRPRAGQKPARAFSFLEVAGEEDEQPIEAVDLVGLAERERK